MGLGMARGGTISSSLPSEGDEFEDEQTDDETGQFEDLDNPDDADAQYEGYANAAERATMEAEAHAQGWRPLDQYRGKPGGWVSAKVFIERGKNYLPFVQKELRDTKDANQRMAGEMEQLRTLVASTQADMARLLDFSRKAGQAGYDRAVKDLKAQQREAVAAGDTETFDKITVQLDEMDSAREDSAPPEPAKVPPPKPTPAVAVDNAYTDWLAENPWFNRDRVLNAAMIEAHNAVIAESPAMALYDQLEKAKEAVMADFPKKFGLDETPRAAAPRRPAAPLPPRSGGRAPAPRAGDDPIESLTDPRERADARAGYASAKKSMPSLTKAEYMEIFSDPHSDVLDTLARHKSKK